MWKRSALRLHLRVLKCILYCVGGNAMIGTVFKEDHFGSKWPCVWGKTNSPFGLHLHILSISLSHWPNIPFSMSLGSYSVTPSFPFFFPCVFISSLRKKCSHSTITPLRVHSSVYLPKRLYKIVYLISYKHTKKLLGVILWFFIIDTEPENCLTSKAGKW